MALDLLQGVDVKGQRVIFSDDSGKEVSIGYDLLVGADGVNSRVRCVPHHLHTLSDRDTHYIPLLLQAHNVYYV